MKLTKTVQWSESVKCPKCRGTGHLYWYQHKEGGRCFRCGGSGEIGEVITFKEVPLTDDEVIAALQDKGFSVMLIEPVVPDGEDWLEIFMSESSEYGLACKARENALAGARLLLASL